MLAISLMRMGAKKKPFYRVVVKEKRSKRDGKYLENVGTYDPMKNPAEVDLKHDRVEYWISVGAQPTETVASLIKNNPFQTEEEKAEAKQTEPKKSLLKSRRNLTQKKPKPKRRKQKLKKSKLKKPRLQRLEAEQAEAEQAAAESAESENSDAENVSEANTETSATGNS